MSTNHDISYLMNTIQRRRSIGLKNLSPDPINMDDI